MDRIFIPTKNRVKNCSFVQMLVANNLQATLVVEPQDYEQYKNAYPSMSFFVLPADNRGITFSRNCIKQYTEDNNIHKYWTIDDDITQFYVREGNKMIKAGVDVLEKAEAQFESVGAAIGALDYQQIAWSASKDLTINTYCEVAVRIDNTLCFGMRYDATVEGKEDRDFVMQIIKAKKIAARSTLYAFACPSIGSNEGGNKENLVNLKKVDACCDALIAKWGEDICQKQIKNSGRPDVKIHWNRIGSGQTSLF
jgi:hypothetical protein